MKQRFRSYLRTGIAVQVIIILILTLVIFFAAYYQPGKSCTNFTAMPGMLPTSVLLTVSF